jgi:hypothetical protein
LKYNLKLNKLPIMLVFENIKLKWMIVYLNQNINLQKKTSRYESSVRRNVSGSEAVQVNYLVIKSRNLIKDRCREHCGDTDYEFPLP